LRKRTATEWRISAEGNGVWRNSPTPALGHVLAAEVGGESPEVVVVDDDEVAVVGGEHLDHAVGELPVRRDERSVLVLVEVEVGAGVGRRDRTQVMEKRPEVALAEAVVELGVADAVEVHGEAGEVLQEVVVQLLGGDDPGFDRGREGADVGDGRGGEAKRELERGRVGVEGEGEAERRVRVRRRAEGEPVGRHDAPRRRRAIISGDGRRQQGGGRVDARGA
jgi:hypothetical protein